MKAKKRVASPDKVAEQTNLDLTETATQENKISTVDLKENESKKSKRTLEKSSSLDKERAPQIILTYTDANGTKQTKTFGCASLRLSEFKDQEFTKSGPKTTLNISIEASVIETM